ncbi:sulfotransferase family 2 domain-containing protein [Planktotalea sp.]|uniref:sulfotransferase family 2 domain-containing protein n=1 Tax=Planktotalea sp. TaxID=2029877 RepID=UPI0032967C3B
MTVLDQTSDTARIVFLHIPKTAGQSVHSELTRLLPDDCLSPVRVHTQAKADEAQMPEGYRLYSGHLDWDELDTVPSPRFAFTVLRDPLERIASFYFYLRAQAETLSPEELALPQRTGMRLISTQTAEEYFFGGNKSWQVFIRDHYDNVQTTYLATRRIRGWGQVKNLSPDELLEKALKNAKNIDRIYTTTTLKELETDLENLLGTRPNIVKTRVNAGPQTSGKRWPELAKLLGPSASERLAAYGETDRRLLQKLGQG